MDIETQLAFIDSEIKRYTDGLATLQAMRDTISGKVSAQLASLPGLITTNAQLIQERSDILNQVATLEDQKIQLQKANDTLQTDNEQIKAQEVNILSEKTII